MGGARTARAAAGPLWRAVRINKSATTSAAALISTALSPQVVAALPPLPEKVRLVQVTSLARIYIRAGAFSVRDNVHRARLRIASEGSVQLMTVSSEKWASKKWECGCCCV